jgi:Grx4 family monothiol glutaredoxin
MKGTPDFPQCGFSAQTAAALRAVNARYTHVNIFEEPELREALKAYSNWPTYPQLYVKGELVGGSDIGAGDEGADLLGVGADVVGGGDGRALALLQQFGDVGLAR